MEKTEKKKSLNLMPYGIIILLIILAVILAVGAAIWGDYRDELMENQKEQLLITSKTLAESMELSMKEYRNNLEFLCKMEKSSESIGIYEAYLDMKDGVECDIFRENAAEEITWDMRQIYLKNSILITSIRDDEDVCMYEDTAGKKYFVFRKKLDTGERLCLAVDARMYYEQLISGLQIGTNGYIMVKNSSGLILMHPQDEQWGIQVIEGRKKMYPELDYSSLEEMVKEQCSGGEGISEYYSYWWSDPKLTKVKKISAYAPVSIEDDFWVISAVVDYDDYYAPIEAGFRKVSLLFIGTLVMFGVLAVVLGKLLLDRRRALEEIEALREVNERLEEIRQGEEMIAHQQRLQVMGTMTGGIAHEFNNFLTPIMGYAELLMLELPEESEEYDSAKEIYEASEKAKDVIRQISSLSRRNVETVYKSIQVSKLFSRMIKMVESICPVNVHLEHEARLGEEEILGNATQINQVLLNICVNAVHAIGKKEGIIRIQAYPVERRVLEAIPELERVHISQDWGRYIQINVSDNGCGMDAETLRQIFIPFFTTKKAGEGTGLGLALAEQIVTAHKGYIYAESELSKGTVFHIFLPVMEAGRDMEVIEKSRQEELKIVIADDNAKVLRLLEKNFARLNLHIITCREKKELQRILEEEHPDVLVIDESVADGSGVDFCMSIQGKYPDMIKLVMADCFTKEVVEAKQKRIIDGYLSKPVSDTSILEAIRSCLD